MAAAIPTKHRVTFSLVAPHAQDVQLVGDFSGWEQYPVAMKKLKSGQWKATVSLKEGTHQYRYLVDGHWIDDPNCTARVPNSYGSQNCVCVVV